VYLCCADLRLSKLQLMAENFAGAVNNAIDAILASGKGTSAAPGSGASSVPKAAKPVERYVPNSQLPESIQMNREPYMQGDWRKEPYIPRRVPFWLSAAASLQSATHVSGAPFVS